jgi:pantothenate kinase type III
LVFLTGGDAEFFDIKVKSSIFAVPDLVLRGLARIVECDEKIF